MRAQALLTGRNPSCYLDTIKMYGYADGATVPMGNEWRVARTYFSSLEGILRDTEKQGYAVVLIAQLDPAKTRQQFEVVVISKRPAAATASTSDGPAISPEYGSFTSDRESVYLDP